MKAPTLELDAGKINEYKQTIRYMLGQPHSVHTHKDSMIPAYGTMERSQFSQYFKLSWADIPQ